MEGMANEATYYAAMSELQTAYEQTNMPLARKQGHEDKITLCFLREAFYTGIKRRVSFAWPLRPASERLLGYHHRPRQAP